MPDCVEQVGFAQPDVGVQHKRVIDGAGAVGDGLGGGVGELVGFAHDKAVECVAGV